jgi:hypothetical protein
MGVVDTSQGATITVPELPKGRYVSVYLVDNDLTYPLISNDLEKSAERPAF